MDISLTINEIIKAVDWVALSRSALRILLILVLSLVVWRLIPVLLGKFEKQLVKNYVQNSRMGEGESEKRANTIISLIRKAVAVVFWLIIGLTLLNELGVQMGPLLASAGVMSLAIGFGAQNLVKDVISGFFLLLEDQVRVGDVALINGTGGLVEKVRFRSIVLRDLQGIVHVFPNGSINTLSNMTYDWSAYVMDIKVAYKEDMDHVMDVMKKVGHELKQDQKFGPLMIADLEVFGVDTFADNGVTVKARLRTKPLKQWDVGREYRRRLKLKFESENIQIPFPHMSVYFGETSKAFAITGESIANQAAQS